MKSTRIITIFSSIIIEILLSIGILGSGLSLFSISPPKWIESIVDNWLIILLNINLQIGRYNSQSLQELHIIDFIFFFFIGIIFLRLTQRLHMVNKLFTYISLSFPILGVLLLLVTKTAGRSGLLIGALIYSIIMLWSKEFQKALAITGIIGSTLLFFGGDIGTTLLPPNKFVAGIIIIGYLLWIIWYGGILITEINQVK